VGTADAVFEFPSIGPGDTLVIHWQTTAGDAAATLGHGIAGLAAELLVEDMVA
jgi:hypothetical protein